MRFAIISDLHGNLQAWTAVLNDMRSIGVDQILCLGDVVGYGPQPAEVLSGTYAHVHNFVLGNHDAVVAGKLDPTNFNDDARAVIEWTSQQLDGKAPAFFASLPYVLEGPGFRCVHAEPNNPQRFGYIFEREDAAEVWDDLDDQLIFIGHSHVPGLFVQGKSRMPHWLTPCDFALEQGKRYIVNVGSVGQPRDGDPRASYCYYDVEHLSVNFRRVPFDTEAYRTQLARTPIPPRTSYFLQVADATQEAPLRDMLDFRPPIQVDPNAGELSVKRLEGAKRKARTWRRRTLVLLVLLAVSLGALGGLLQTHLNRPLSEYRFHAQSLNAAPTAPTVGEEISLAMESTGAVGPDNRLEQWTVVLKDTEQQAVISEEWTDPAKRSSKGDQVFRLRSSQHLPLSLESSAVPAGPAMRFGVAASFKKLSLEAGTVELRLVQRLADGTEKLIGQRTIDRLTRDDSWIPGSFTMDSSGPGLRDEGLVQLVIRADFSGEVLVRNCRITRKKDGQ